MQKHFIFIELERGEISKPFDGMAAGEFTSMDGRKVSFLKEDLVAYLENTQAALESTKDSSGQIIGLPIDGRNHDHGDAAGWIVGVELSGDGEKILFTPRWTDFGRDLIENDIQRFFSPSVDTKNKVIMGGSLTNWPATRNDDGEILLSPVELSVGVFGIGDRSFSEVQQTIATALMEEYADAWPVEFYEDSVIAYFENKLYRVEYTESDDGVTFQKMDEWTEVKQSYVDAMKNFFLNFLGLNGRGELPPDDDDQEENDMPKTPTELMAALQSTDEGKAELDSTAQLRAELIAAEIVEKKERESHVSEFAARVVGGDSSGLGLPVTEPEIKELMSKLYDADPDLAKEVEGVLEKVTKDGLVEFGEKGHSKEKDVKEELPAEYRKHMKTWVNAGNDPESFFDENPEVGKADQYDLSKYEAKE